MERRGGGDVCDGETSQEVHEGLVLASMPGFNRRDTDGDRHGRGCRGMVVDNPKDQWQDGRHGKGRGISGRREESLGRPIGWSNPAR